MASGFLISLIILIVWVTNSELKAVDTRTSERSSKKIPPNIIFILADDMGWNDVSFHGSDEIPTPNIDALGYNGVILNRHYVQPVCTPTRAALLTGKYPIHTGMQGNPILASEKRGLPLEEKTIAQHLKNLGYATHIVGKWHLGYYQTEYTPLQRGFDSHFGYYNGMISYYDHIMEDLGKYSSYSGHDFRRNYTTAWDCQGKYATDIFTEEAVNVINQHNKREPLFMYLSHLAVHAGNEGKWLEAPQEVIDRFRYIPNPNRRTYAAMVSKLDDSVGKVMEALQSRHMLSNSIVVFLSDNGAPITDYFKNWGSNQPFRGEKGSLWESAVRTPAVVWSPLINKTSRVSKQLMHVTDWLPTLYAAAGGAEGDLGKELDGINLWQTITQNKPSPRKELVVNINKKEDSGALIAKMKNEESGKEETFKIILGKSKNGDFRYVGKTSSKPPYNTEDILSSLTNKAIKKVIDKSVDITQVERLRSEATIMCERVKNSAQCNDVCLFNLENDPCEHNDLSQSSGMVLDYMRELYNIQYKTVVPQLPSELDAAANPALFNYTWSSWVPSKIDLHTENGFFDKSIYNYHVLN